MRIILAILLFSTISWAKTVKVAVLDTGFDFKYKNNVKLCESGHKTFRNRSMPDDLHGHGTNVAGLIANENDNVDYCMIIVDGVAKGSNYIRALVHIINQNVDIVNISAGGEKYILLEDILIKRLLSKGVKVVVAAGNEAANLDNECTYYPACLDNRLIVIGNTSKSSNYGTIVDEIINGNNQTALGITLSGSSQSTAIKTGRLIKELND